MSAVIIRNSFYNLLGMGLPIGVAFIAIPALIEALGPSRFGILTLIWAVVSYFGLFDLGLGRVMTQQVSASLALGDHERVRRVVGTSILLMLGLGVAGGLILGVTAPWMSVRIAGPQGAGEVYWALLWMALAMPFIVLTSGYRGLLEAFGRFGLVNAIRLPMGVFTFAGPLAVVLAGHSHLDAISAVLCVGRVLACGVHAVFAERTAPSATALAGLDRSLFKTLLSLGGWMSVSNVISPLLSYVDRFVVGFTVSTAAVAYYATPQEIILRLGVLPGAVAAALFPFFAARAASGDGSNNADDVKRYSLLMLVATAPVALFLSIWSKPLLAWWIDPAFAETSAQVLSVMAFAFAASAVAQVPFAMLQGRGRADITAKLHLVEFPIYVGLLYVLTSLFGPIGAAWAWSARIAGDMIVLYVLNHRTDLF